MTLYLVGGGYTADAIARAWTASDRSPEKYVFLRRRKPSSLPEPATIYVDNFQDFPAIFTADDAAIVTFPPAREAATAPLETTAEASLAAVCTQIPVVYVSSVALYGNAKEVSLTTATAKEADPLRFAAEEHLRAAGALVLRAPAIYGADRGLHRRIARGEHRIPGDGSRFTSRIHVDDLAALAIGAICTLRDGARSSEFRGAIYPVGDEEPCTHAEIAQHICAAYNYPFPASIPLEEAPATLRGDRKVDGSAARAAFDVTLRYPSYRDAYPLNRQQIAIQ